MSITRAESLERSIAMRNVSWWKYYNIGRRYLEWHSDKSARVVRFASITMSG
jgi:hypothetical protein